MRLVCSLLLLFCSAGAHASWWVSGDIENFRWEEAGPPTVTEKGPRYGVGWGFTRERPSGWQWAYRGEFRRGTVNYTGALLFDPSQPVTARTRYTGLVNEGQGIYRLAHPLGVEFVGGLGLDYWERNILPDQKEDYGVLFLRLGMNLDPRAPQGWFGGGGVKLPLYVAENAHFVELGFDQNPRLEPKGRPSLYAETGYRFTRQWSLIGYYDSYRFGESSVVRVTTSEPAACSPRPAPCALSFVQPASKIDTFGLRLRYHFQ